MRKLILVLAISTMPATVVAAGPIDVMLDNIQHTAFNYFWNEANPSNGMIRDRSQVGSVASIAAVGFGLSAICTGIDHGWITRAQGQARVHTTLTTFWTKPQGTDPSTTIGYQGFFYHFLDMNTALRMTSWNTELSTIDTALLLAGILDCKQYFNTADPVDVQIRTLADQIYGRVDWEWIRNPSNNAIRHGWDPDVDPDPAPEPGFLPYDWIGYSEAMILNILALGSPTHPVPTATWTAWTSGYNWSNPGYGGNEYVVFPPLFGHQYSHCWLDFRNKRDTYMQVKGIDYFENSRRATLAQQAYCIANPFGRTGYAANQWGLTAGDGPGFTYAARGAPPAQNDDGTITPTAVVGSLPFAPEICLPTIQNFYDNYPALWGTYGFRDGFNLTANPDWYGPDYLGIDQGPIVLMIENYSSGAVWNRFMQNADVQVGMTRAGFVNTVGVSEPPVLAQNRPVLWSAPNPFSNATSVNLWLPTGGLVRLTVHDVTGCEVARLLDGWTDAGRHSVAFRGDGLKSGVYWFRLNAGSTEVQSKSVLMR